MAETNRVPQKYLIIFLSLFFLANVAPFHLLLLCTVRYYNVEILQNKYLKQKQLKLQHKHYVH